MDLSTLKDSVAERASVAAQKLAEVGAKAGGVSAYVLAARGDETLPFSPIIHLPKCTVS